MFLILLMSKPSTQVDYIIAYVTSTIRDEIIDQTFELTTCGILIKHNKNIYVVVRHDDVRYAIQIKVSVFNNKKETKFNAFVAERSYEFGLSLLQIKSEIESWINYNNIYEINKIAPAYMENKFDVNICSIKYPYKKIVAKAKITSCEFRNIYNKYSPRIPIHTFQSDSINESFVGGAVLDSKLNIVGIVNFISDPVYELIPAITILQLFRQKIDMCGLPINFSENGLTFDDVKNSFINGTVKFSFEKDDKIVSINETEVSDTKNTIFLPKFNKNVPIDTYLAYTCSQGEYTLISTKKHSELKIKNKLMKKMYSLPYSIPILSKINIMKNIFVEFSYEILVRMQSVMSEQKLVFHDNSTSMIDKMCVSNVHNKPILLLRTEHYYKFTSFKIMKEPFFGLIDDMRVELLFLKTVNDGEFIKNFGELRTKKKIKKIEFTNDFVLQLKD